MLLRIYLKNSKLQNLKISILLFYSFNYKYNSQNKLIIDVHWCWTGL